MTAFLAKVKVISTILILYVHSIWTGHFPGGTFTNDTTTCEEFSRFARFNPYSIVSDEWMVFYYWGPPEGSLFVKFYVPTTKQLDYLKYVMEGHLRQPINWTARSLLMIERNRNNNTYFLVEQNDRGHYHLYEPVRGLEKDDILELADIRIKQTGDNKYFAIMDCAAQKVFMFARIHEVPKKNKIQDEAAKLGFRGRGGKSYLYQGHQWMPIPEADDEEFEYAIKNRHKYKLW